LTDDIRFRHMAERIVVALSGASGAGYCLELLKGLRRGGGISVHLIVSPIGEGILEKETGVDMETISSFADETVGSSVMDHPLASGSNPISAMVICPCTVSTASKIACGIGDNLITRTAGVALKEGRKLILVIRETPLSAPVLRNLYDLASWGVTIMPASPAFYGDVTDLDGLRKALAGRIMDQIGVANDLAPRYDTRGEGDA